MSDHLEELAREKIDDPQAFADLKTAALLLNQGIIVLLNWGFII